MRKISSLAIFCGCTAGFVSDPVENSEDRFSHDAAHIIGRKLKTVRSGMVLMVI